jgi:hypothetical protein
MGALFYSGGVLSSPDCGWVVFLLQKPEAVSSILVLDSAFQFQANLRPPGPGKDYVFVIIS